MTARRRLPGAPPAEPKGAAMHVGRHGRHASAILIAGLAQQQEVVVQIRQPALELGQLRALVVGQGIEQMQNAPPLIAVAPAPHDGIDRRARKPLGDAPEAGQRTGKIATFIHGRLDGLVLHAPGVTLAVEGVGRVVQGKEDGGYERRKARQRLHAPLAQHRRQSGEPVVIAHRGKIACRCRMGRAPAGCRSRQRAALQGQQQTHDFGIEAGGEMLKVGSEDEAGMGARRIGQHRRGIEHLHEAHIGQIGLPAVAAQIIGQRRDDGRDRRIVSDIDLAQPQRQHPTIGQREPQAGISIRRRERLPRQPQPRAHRGRGGPCVMERRWGDAFHAAMMPRQMAHGVSLCKNRCECTRLSAPFDP